MLINWNAPELRIKLMPIGKPLNRSVKSMIVFNDYGDSRLRTIQAIANMLGGETVYFVSVFEGCDSSKKPFRDARQTIPVSGWRSTSSASEYIASVADFIQKAFACNMKVDCFGSSRAKWTLEIEAINASKDIIDNMSDKGLAGDGKTKQAEVVEANGLRTEF